MKPSIDPSTETAFELATIAEIDPAKAEVRVEVDGQLSGWMPLATIGAGQVRVWIPPSVGEQVLVACPDGDLDAGMVVARLHQNLWPAAAPLVPDALTCTIIAFDDGGLITYDIANSRLQITLPQGGCVEAAAPAGFALTGSVEIFGDVQVTGTITATGDVTAGPTSLRQHRHTAVQAGSAVSGPPQ